MFTGERKIEGRCIQYEYKILLTELDDKENLNFKQEDNILP